MIKSNLKKNLIHFFYFHARTSNSLFDNLFQKYFSLLRKNYAFDSYYQIFIKTAIILIILKCFRHQGSRNTNYTYRNKICRRNYRSLDSNFLFSWRFEKHQRIKCLMYKKTITLPLLAYWRQRSLTGGMMIRKFSVSI